MTKIPSLKEELFSGTRALVKEMQKDGRGELYMSGNRKSNFLSIEYDDEKEHFDKLGCYYYDRSVGELYVNWVMTLDETHAPIWLEVGNPDDAMGVEEYFNEELALSLISSFLNQVTSE